jgi:hypothetical protein
VAPAAGDALIVAFHTVNTMTGFGEHQLVDTIVTGTTLEAVRVIRVVAGHDGFIKDWLMADTAIVGTV